MKHLSILNKIKKYMYKTLQIIGIFIGAIVLIVTLSIVFYHLVNHDIYFAEYKKNLKSRYPIINSVEVLGNGPHSTLYIWLKHSIAFEDSEALFLTIMNDIDEGSLMDYLVRNRKGAPVLTVEIHISDEVGDSRDTRRFESCSEDNFQIWYYIEDSNKVKTYHVDDYTK